ncbi:MarR family winged helix-turn-helix transcriptional regulator [Effusibacillus pohliae]|uniref:MarR family winged helix-turn-helix transcriptional regulator n=1 Tax=Effusibacillus pohliae TaxID=232270 RepID=UPI0003631D1C|nr:MarR family transcriptional regulator [Effusibacillus pohliae]
MNERSLLLENQLCFTIYACSREITKLYRPLLEKLGLTYPQYLVLLVLWERDGITVKELGERLYLDSGTLTPLLKRMESSGLVARERSHEDERKVRIRLTGRGKALQEAAREVPYELLCRSGLTADELQRLLAEFQRLLQRVHRQNLALENR